jgi:hypothetical protein
MSGTAATRCARRPNARKPRLPRRVFLGTCGHARRISGKLVVDSMFTLRASRSASRNAGIYMMESGSAFMMIWITACQLVEYWLEMVAHDLLH